MCYDRCAVHKIQRKLLSFITPNGITETTLRKIGETVGVSHPYQVKYHLNKLERSGLIEISRVGKSIARIIPKVESGPTLLSIPIYGSANCGPATLLAEENFEGYLKVSKSFLHANSDNLFALRAVGHSMNRANIHGGPIEDGDYVVADGNVRTAEDKDYAVSVIDGCANIKKFLKEPNRIVLLSESTENIPPIFINENDDFLINGKVVQIIKKPKGSD